VHSSSPLQSAPVTLRQCSDIKEIVNPFEHRYAYLLWCGLYYKYNEFDIFYIVNLCSQSTHFFDGEN